MNKLIFYVYKPNHEKKEMELLAAFPKSEGAGDYIAYLSTLQHDDYIIQNIEQSNGKLLTYEEYKSNM